MPPRTDRANSLVNILKAFFIQSNSQGSLIEVFRLNFISSRDARLVDHALLYYAV